MRLPFEPNTARLLPVLVAVALLATACSQDPKPGTPEAAAAGDRYMRSMSDTLVNSKSFTFDTTEQIEVIAPTGEKRALHFSRKVTVRRPNGLYFELHGTAGTSLEVAAYYDGRTVSLNEKQDGSWAQTAEPGTLDEMLDDVARRFGMPVPIGDVAYSSPYEAFIGSNSHGGFVGRETIDGVPCVKLDYDDAFVEVRLWLPASGPALPHRLELVYKKAAVPLVTQLNFTNWKLDVPVADATFAFQPPAGRPPVEFGEFVSGLVSRIVPIEQHAGSPMAPATNTAVEPAGR